VTAAPDLAAAKPQHVIELEPIPNRLGWQSFSHDLASGCWYVSQSVEVAAGVEDTVVHLYDGAGLRLSSATYDRAGHGTQISTRRVPAGVEVWLSWGEYDTAGKRVGRHLSRILYRPGRFARAEATKVDVFTSRYTLAAIDQRNDLLAVREVYGDGTETYTVRRLSDVLAGVNKPLAVHGPTPVDGTWQGFALGGSRVFWVTGGRTSTALWTAGTPKTVLVHQWDWETGAERVEDFTAAGRLTGDSSTMASEPEGAGVVMLPNAAGELAPTLVVGFKMGSGAAQRLRLVAIAQAETDTLEVGPMKPLWLLEDELATQAAVAAAKVKAEQAEQAERLRIAALAKRNLRPDGRTPISPVAGWTITTPYGKRKAGLWTGKGYHTGEDRSGGEGEADRGEPIVAVAAGVAHRMTDAVLGRVLLVYRDGGGTDWYCHCNAFKVQDGARVRAGQVVATAGDSGTGAQGVHLHHEWHPGVHSTDWYSRDADPTW
jgi:murein DD-endopeptidase MepM/ murein hydrolase activator NlpD